VSSLDAFNALSLCNIGPVSFHFLLDFWHRNAKVHPNRLCFIRCFTKARFWPAGFTLWHRLSKMRPPCGVSVFQETRPQIHRCPRVPGRPSRAAAPILLPPRSPCHPRRLCRPRRVPTARRAALCQSPGPALPSLGPCVCCSDSTTTWHPFLNVASGNASEASPHLVLSRHTGMSVSYFHLSVDLMQSYVR
jgi:hypothetical protein